MDPLLNPLILSNIFKQLPLDGKKNFRQVSKLWEDSTLQSWRDNALVKIAEEQYRENSIGVTLEKFVEVLRKEREEPYRFSENKPLRSFQLNDCSFYLYCLPCKTKWNEVEDEDDEEENGALLNVLFEKIGPTIHHLQLDSSVLIRFDGFIDLCKWILLKACVNLKELQFHPISPEEYRTKPVFQQRNFVQKQALNLVTLKLAHLSLPDWIKCGEKGEAKEFWNIIPNLKNLHLDSCCKALELIKQLKHPLDSGKFIQLERLKLECLDIDSTGTKEVEQIVELTNYITEANPPLTKIWLKLNLCKVRRARDSFKTFLGNCKDTLTSLSVWLYEEDDTIQSTPEDWIVDLSGVSLPNVQCLYFRYENTDDFEGYNTGIRNFDFGALQGFPKLKKLIIQLYGYEATEIENLFGCGRWLKERKLQYGNADDHLGNDYPGNKFLEDFTLWSFQKFDCGSLKKLASWMPSIKCLGVDADETTLPVILDFFSKLTRLSLLKGSPVSGDTLEKVKKTYPGIEIDMLDFDQSLTKCKMPEYF